MKKFTFILAVLFAGTSLFATNPVNEGRVDVKKSTIEWVGKKVTGSHNGTISLKSGDIGMDENGNMSSATFVIDMTSIVCTDLSGNGAARNV